MMIFPVAGCCSTFIEADKVCVPPMFQVALPRNSERGYSELGVEPAPDGTWNVIAPVDPSV